MKYKDVLLAAFSGILFIVIFSTSNFSILAWVSLVPLLLAIKNKNLKQSFFLGFLTGFIAFLGILYWLIMTLVKYGEISFGVSLLILLILVSYLALYIAVFCLIFRFFSFRFPFSRFHFLYGASVWVSLELLRTYFLTGFPWALLGYSQWTSTQIIQISELTGVYGISFLIVMINIALTQVIDNRWRIHDIKDKIEVVVLPAMILLLCWFYGVFIIPKSSAINEQASIRISVVQANILQDEKWNKAKQFDILNKYAELTRQSSREFPQLIVWPETAVPGYLKYDKELYYRVRNIAWFNKSWLIVGGSDAEKEDYYNSAFLISPQGKIVNKYDKMHLVLFGEKIPLRKTLSKFFKILEEVGDYTPGNEFSLLKTPSVDFGVVICFESVFPDLFRRFVKNGAQIMVNITEDGWYGRTSAAYQHFSVNIFRAIENRVSVVRAANTGISGFIDPYGRAKNISDIFIEDFLTDNVVLRQRETFYTKYGDIFSYLCAIVTILFVIIAIVKSIGSRVPLQKGRWAVK